MRYLVAILIIPILFLSCAKKPLLTAETPGLAFKECGALADDHDYEDAIECFELLKGRFPGTKEAIDSDIEIGDVEFAKEEYLIAAEHYSAFARVHPTHHRVNYVHYKCGLSYFKETPKAIDRDQQYLDDALVQFEIVLRREMRGELKTLAEQDWKEARIKQARRHFYVGKFYYKTGECLAAVPRFKTILSEFSGLGLDEKSLYYMGLSYIRLGDKENALNTLETLENSFPDSKYRKKLTGELRLS